MLHRTLRNAKRRADAITRGRDEKIEFERHRAEITAWFQKTRERYARGELAGLSAETLEAIRLEAMES